MFFSQKTVNANQFENTKWKYMVNKDCIDYLQFKSDTKVMLYDCEIDLIKECKYIIHQDTLFITENELSEGSIAELWKYTFILITDELHPIQIKQFANKKLYSHYDKFDKNYFYKKAK